MKWVGTLAVLAAALCVIFYPELEFKKYEKACLARDGQATRIGNDDQFECRSVRTKHLIDIPGFESFEGIVK